MINFKSIFRAIKFKDFNHNKTFLNFRFKILKLILIGNKNMLIWKKRQKNIYNKYNKCKTIDSKSKF